MYTINEDGTVTRKASSYESSSPQQSGGSDDNTGCWVVFSIAILIGVVFFALATLSGNSPSQETAVEPIDERIIDSVKEDESDEPYLSISASSVSFDSEGGYYTFTVNSSSSWDISMNTYKWGHLSRSDNHLTLKVDANPSMESRTDFFLLSAGNKTVRVDILQAGKSSYFSSNISGAVKDVWVDHNVSDSNGDKGMRIHIKFNIYGMLNKRGQAAAYFYYSSGNPLKDTNGRCCTSNGDVATHVDFTPNYDNCLFNDLIIFMPYTELHLNRSASCFFTISIWNGNNEIVQSGKYYFELIY